MMWAVWTVAGLLVVLSAGLTAAHAAASQIGASRLRTLTEEGFSGAASLAQAREREADVRVGIRLATQTLDLAALGILAVERALSWDALGPTSLTLAGAIVVVIVVADLVPRAAAARSPVRIALASAPLLLLLGRWTRLVTAPLGRLEERIVGGNDEALTSEQRELRELREIGEQEGVLEETESLLVERAFHLDELTAWDVMVPRVDIFAWKDDLTLEEILGVLPEVPYSRVPVYAESVDDVTGIVYVREAYERVTKGGGALKLRDIARTPFFVPGSLSLTQLLRDFQVRRIHLGIVADEFGGTDGLVTLEDVLEELVGEIHDETDVESQEIIHVSPVSLEVGAGVDVRDINEALDVTLPKAEHRSLNGFILEELGHVPDIGASFERAGVQIEILEATDTQVVKARLTKVAHLEDEGAESA